MTDTFSRKRQPRGTTTGGQFATESRSEAGVSLTSARANDVLTPQQRREGRAARPDTFFLDGIGPHNNQGDLAKAYTIGTHSIMFASRAADTELRTYLVPALSGISGYETLTEAQDYIDITDEMNSIAPHRPARWVSAPLDEPVAAKVDLSRLPHDRAQAVSRELSEPQTTREPGDEDRSITLGELIDQGRFTRKSKARERHNNRVTCLLHAHDGQEIRVSEDLSDSITNLPDTSDVGFDLARRRADAFEELEAARQTGSENDPRVIAARAAYEDVARQDNATHNAQFDASSRDRSALRAIRDSIVRKATAAANC